jgi:ABC-type transport system involved in multi-copper enzyme maturation permease subunit
MPVFLRWLLRLGPTNPITVRLIQGGSRRARHFYIRTIYLGGLIAVLLYSLLLNAPGAEVSYRTLAQAGADSFAGIAYLQIALICILAPVFMAGAIAQEASPRTWEILLTTPLSATQIVLGNMLGRLFFIIALLVSSLPLFAVTQYFGGVPGSSIFASYLIAGCAALLVASIAIALSVSRLVGKRAVFAFYVAVISYLALTMGIDAVISTGGVTYMTAINPFLALKTLLDPTGYPRAPAGTLTGLSALMLETPVTGWCVLSSAVSAVLLVLSIATVRIGGLAGVGLGASSGGENARAPWYRRIFGLPARGALHRAPRAVWHNPIAWREAAARNATLSKMIARWTFIATGALFAVGLMVYYHGGSLQTTQLRTILLYTVVGELAVISLVAVNMAATAVAREREDGTLDLLLTTPITPGQYLTGKLRGMIAYLTPMLAVPLGTLGLAGLYVAAVQGGVIPHEAGWEVIAAQNPKWAYAVNVPYQPQGAAGPTYAIPAVLPEAALVATVATLPFIAFCVMVGLHWSLKSKASLAAVVATVGIVGAAAGTVGLCAFQAGSELPILGPVIAALSPGAAVFSLVYPEQGLAATISESSPATARLGLLIGSVVAALAYSLVVWGIHTSMVKNFDFTVRKLAGTK